MIGKTISHYHLLEKIGGGGMGTVYRAEDTRLRRTVALKFLAPELTRDEDAKKRFVHEAQAASALDHPNICSIFDIDETPEGQLFIVMACYGGESLKQRIARRKIEVREAFEIAYAIALGLARAHAGGIVHRDVKPANIMITSDGFVKIVDFGLAKLAGRSRVTSHGKTVGTVAYMSPEQARGEESDARTDIWSLGAVLYEMLTGRTPFRGDIDQAMVYSILNEVPAPMEEVRGDVPEACRAIVSKCLEKDPEKRYPSAEVCCEAMESAAGAVGWGASFPKGTISAVSRFGGERVRSRRPVLLGLAVGVVLAICVPIGWRLVANREASPYSTDIRLAVLPFERLGDAPSQAFVDGLSYWVASVFDRSSRFHESMWCLPYEKVLRDSPGDPQRMRSAFGVNRLVTGELTPYKEAIRFTFKMLDAETMRVLDTRSVTFDAKHPADFAAGVVRETAQALELADASAAIEKTTGLGDAPVEAQASYFEGLGHLFRKGQRAAHEAAIVSFTEALEPDPGFPAARAALGQAYYSCFRETNDETCVVAAERELESALSADSMLIEARVWLGRLYQQTDRIKDAVSLLESAVHVDSVSIIANEQLMSSYYTDGRYREAEELFLALQRRLPDYFGVPLALGWCYRQAGQHDMAMATYQRAFALAPTDFRTLNGLALQYSDAGDNVRARELWEQAFLARPDCGSCSNLGWVTYHEGQFRESVRWFEFALEYCDTTKFETWAYLASALYWTGDGRERSLRLYRRAIDLARKKFAEAPDDAYTAASLADFFAMVDDRENALSMIEVAAGSSDGAVLCRLAQVCEFLGDRVRALQFAGEALRRNYPLFDMTTEPFLKEMVDDPRFQQMVEGAKASAEEAN